MRELRFDGALLADPRQLQDALAERFAFPTWYGRNLDALYDALGDVAEPTAVVLQNWEQEGYQAAVLRVMRDAAEENPALTILPKDGE